MACFKTAKQASATGIVNTGKTSLAHHDGMLLQFIVEDIFNPFYSRSLDRHSLLLLTKTFFEKRELYIDPSTSALAKKEFFPHTYSFNCNTIYLWHFTSSPSKRRKKGEENRTQSWRTMPLSPSTFFLYLLACWWEVVGEGEERRLRGLVCASLPRGVGTTAGYFSAGATVCRG